MREVTGYALLAAGLLLGALVEPRLRAEASAVKLLLHLSLPLPKAGDERDAPSRTEDLVVGEGSAASHARIYYPDGPVYRCAVVAHGVHYKGIEEPRLVRFSTELARAGMLVLTPELRDLADYRITRSGADVLSAAVKHLASRCGREVGLVGFSFAGGLSLLAAEDPEVNRHLAYVASVGGYHDLSRVLRYLLTDVVEGPTGKETRPAHEYGLVVLLYGRLQAFAPQEDLDVLSEAYRDWLHEDRARAWAVASAVTTKAGEDLFVKLATGHVADYREAIGAVLTREAERKRDLSPAGRLDAIPVPVLLLHGTGDRVIPREETLWAAAELGPHRHVALVTPLIEHVEISHPPKLREALALVDFMARLF
ncbi:MAG TPA: hypothetical protein VHE30_25780 [Polyangiaceae bacterium]|nr:hypothetical protein [Polyangiaceae bacterium]